MKIIYLYLCAMTQMVIAQEPFDFQIPKNDGDYPENYLEKIEQERYYKIKVSFKVVGENEQPITNADINVGINSILHVDGFNNYKGKTNKDGLYTVESRGQGCSEVVVTKKGYYPSRPDVKWDGKLNPGGDIMHKNGGFRPWNPTIIVVLKKIEKPIPMRVWMAESGKSHLAPKIGEECGFDLFEKDWVKPHGKGQKSDLIVKFTSIFKAQNDYKSTCSIRFLNPEDGLIPIPELICKESRLKYPRVAPLDGYAQKEIVITKASGGGEARLFAKEKEPKGYLIRFRTIKAPKTGEILSAYYGKITAPTEQSDNVNPFELGAYMWKDRKIDSTPRLSFSFYLNPTLNDRNLEYDQVNNLAPDAPRGAMLYP